MDGREVITNSTPVTVVGSDAPSEYQVAPRTTDNPTGSTPAPPPPMGVSPPPSAAAGAVVVTGKKKRGRPRKYGPDGAVNSVALSPKPISSSVPPPVIDFSSEKRGKIRSVGTTAAKHHHHQQPPRAEVESIGDWVSCSVGANFTPHILNVNAGEDVNMKIISFSQQGPRAICILSANGMISSVTLRQPDSSGGTLTYEGRFEILSLTGSFMPSETGGIRNRTGGMSVSLASPDGRVVGGGVAGLLVAAGPVQIVVGSFLAGNQHEQKAKKQKPEAIMAAPTSIVYPVPSMENHVDDAYRTTTSFRGESWPAMQNESRNKPADINVSLHG